MTRDTIDRSGDHPAAGKRERLVDRLRSVSNVKALASVLAIAAAFLLLTTLLDFPHGPEHWSADLRTRFLSKRLDTQHAGIALVYVTDKTLAPYPYLSPTDRKLLAEVVRAVDAAGPKAIGFDFIIDRPSDPAKDEELFAALRDAKAKVVVGAIDDPKVGAQGKSYQARYLEKVKRPVGHLYFDEMRSSLVVSDHVIRQMANPRTKHDHEKSLARLLVDAAGSYPEPRSTYISWLLEPRDGSETFQALSAEQVLGRDGPPLPIKEMFKDKIVLIGGNFADRDQHLLPLSVLGDVRYPGLFVHAQVVAQLLDQRSLATLSLPLQVVALAIAAWLSFWGGRWYGHNFLAAELISVMGLLLVGAIAFRYANLIMPYTALLLTWLAGLAVGHYTRPRQE